MTIKGFLIAPVTLWRAGCAHSRAIKEHDQQCKAHLAVIEKFKAGWVSYSATCRAYDLVLEKYSETVDKLDLFMNTLLWALLSLYFYAALVVGGIVLVTDIV